MCVRTTVAAMVLSFAPAAFAAEVPTLVAGKPAPPFKVERFLKGKEFTAFEKGKVYVVEFWATWCGPCIASMPHLSELQREYGARGVTITGVNVLEDDVYTEKTLTKAADFVKGRGDAMNYTVAYDGASKQMDKNWMQAAGQTGIPVAFVVDRNSTIAWIGHPVELGIVLDEVVKGTWSVENGPKKIEAATKAYQHAAAKYKDSLSAGDEAWDKAVKEYPAIAKVQNVNRFMGMLEGKHTNEAYALGNKIVDAAAAAKDPMPVMSVLGVFMNEKSRPKNYDKALFLKAAHTSFDLSPDDHKRHAMMALVYFTAGDFDKGKAAAAKAIELADESVKAPLKNWLEQTEAKAREANSP